MYLATVILAVGTALTVCDNHCRCWARSSEVFQRNMTPLEFLRHVLNNESKWRDVLEEKLKSRAVTGSAGDLLDPLVSADTLADENAVFSVRDVLTGVVYRHNKLKSMVDYGCRLLYTSLQCNAVRHAAFQAQYVSRLIDMRVDPYQIMAEVTTIKQVVVSFIDKLAMSTVDLSLIFTMYWELLTLIQEDAVHNVRPAVYPPKSNSDIDLLRGKLVQFLADNCAPYGTKTAFGEYLRTAVPGLLITDDVLNVSLDEETMLKVGRAHLRYVSRLYVDLGVSTLTYEMWAQLFYTGKKGWPSDRRDETNAPITRSSSL